MARRKSRNQWLRELREAAGYTQAQVAEECDVTVKTISNAENKNGSLPHGKTLMRMLEVYGALDGIKAVPRTTLDQRLEKIEQGLDEALRLLRVEKATQQQDAALEKAARPLRGVRAIPRSSPATRPKKAS